MNRAIVSQDEKYKFAPTRWSLVSAMNKGDERKAKRALNDLLSLYWPPLYAYARGSGRSIEDAEDIVQGYMTTLLERESLQSVNKSKGKLRSFLLNGIKNYMHSELRKIYAAKRGAGEAPVSLDDAELKYQRLPSSDLSPDALYDRAWTLELLNATVEKLEQKYQSSPDKQLLFEHIKVYLGMSAEASTPYAKVAAALGKSEGSIKVAVSRLRKEYKEILTANVRDTIAEVDDASVKKELAELLSVV